MNPTATMLRWYRQSTGRAAPQQQQYTAEEVLQLLRPNRPQDVCTIADSDLRDRPDDDRGARTEAVRQAAARTGAWLDKLTQQQRREIGQLADRLPSLVFHHTVGGDTSELVQRFGGWSTWRYERALEVAGTCIASHLNNSR